MEKDKPKFIGRVLENEMNPSEKICDILKCKNLHDLIKIFSKSKNAAEAIRESFIPLCKLKKNITWVALKGNEKANSIANF